MRDVRLTESDRTVFAVCPNCNVGGLGLKAPQFYSMAYTVKQWNRSPVCDNCNTHMQEVYRIKGE